MDLQILLIDKLIFFHAIFILKEMAGTHPQGMDHRNYDGKTGSDSNIFSKYCLVAFFAIIVIVVVIFLP